jgi:16S rRNA (cytosine1402-N4)-methyltransferase
MEVYHEPVLLNECIEGLNIDPTGTYVDVTFGGGGHSRAIFSKLTTGRLIAFDQDNDAERNAIDDERFLLIKQNFRYLKNYLKMHQALPIDGLLADLGVSSHQFDEGERGFSTRTNADLDMRMDRDAEVTAEWLLNNKSEEELYHIFYNYGELKNAKNLARAIVAGRNEKPLKVIDDLKSVIGKFATRGKENQFFAQAFQALRIEVNEELDALKELLEQSADVMKKGGRLVVISYHSLEDRLVKNYLRKGKFEGEVEKDLYGNFYTPFKDISKKPIVPGEEELKRNNRSRSAKLRIAEKN